ncbi:MAG TPA: hypothetical protein VFF12_05325 [Myxococcaceae bacterium]|nr:hypothetical protein [Myxococcaceae bacterium]
MQTDVNSSPRSTTDQRYGRALENARKIRWDIDKDVIRGREFDYSRQFLPDGLSMIGRLKFLTAADAQLLSQIQGRTYANIFGLVERFINAKVLELSREHWLGDQVALEALVGFSQEELKHQELFRRLEQMMSASMPAGYQAVGRPDDVASLVLGKATWAVLALTCHIELFTQVHYLESIQPDASLSPLFKDVLLFHWKEESQHAILDELEWTRCDRGLSAAERDAAVDDFIALVGAVDGLLQAQSKADVEYFRRTAETRFTTAQVKELEASVLRAYRWQYIISGAQHPRFLKLLMGMITPAQADRITRALAPIAA